MKYKVHIVNTPIAESQPPQRDGAQTVDRAMALLRMVGGHHATGVSLGDLVAESGLNKPTVRRLLLALIRSGMVDQNAQNRRYYLGEETYVLGTFAATRHGLLDMAAEQVTRLAQKTGDAAFVSVRRGLSALCLHREEGSCPIRTYALMTGAVHPLGVGAGSLAMLASLADDEVEAVLAANSALLLSTYPQLSLSDLRAHVRTTRAAGYALNPGLIFPDSWGIGVALRRPDGALAGALSLATVESRMQQPRRAELVEALRQAAALIEIRIAHRYAARP